MHPVTPAHPSAISFFISIAPRTRRSSEAAERKVLSQQTALYLLQLVAPLHHFASPSVAEIGRIRCFAFLLLAAAEVQRMQLIQFHLNLPCASVVLVAATPLSTHSTWLPPLARNARVMRSQLLLLLTLVVSARVTSMTDPTRRLEMSRRRKRSKRMLACSIRTFSRASSHSDLSPICIR